MGFASDSYSSTRNSDGWKITSDVIYTTNSGDVIMIWAPFDTDLASIPAYLRWWMSNMEYGIAKSAILHDYLYGKDRRKYADSLFYEALVSEGVNRFKARVMYLGLRAGGWRAFNKAQKG